MIGDKIKELREARMLTQAQMSEQTGININTLASYERNIREPRIEVITQLCNFFGVSADYLMDISPYQNVAHSESVDKAFDKLPANMRKQCVEIQLALIKAADAIRWAGENEPIFSELLQYLIDDLQQCIGAYLRQLDYNTPETNWETAPNYFVDLFIHDRVQLFKNVSAVTDLIYQRRNIGTNALLRHKSKTADWQ